MIGLVLAVALSQPAATHQARVYHRIERLIQDDAIKVPWDGRYRHSKSHGLEIETFNGTRHNIRQDGHGVPPGFYLKFSADGNYWVNDGTPFQHMHAW